MNSRTFEGRASRHVKAGVRLALGLGALGIGFAPVVSMAAEGDEVLTEIIVTAQFREQNLQDTPLSITAVSGAMLESRSQTNITEVANQAPNVTLKPQGAAWGPSIAASIRGIGQYDFNPALEPGVGIYVDDVYFATLTGSVLDLLDLDRVEILRGPQGTLAGKNSIGGAVKLYSQKPKGDDTGSFSATYGSRRRIDMRGGADFAISDKLFARVSAVSKKQDGYVDRVDYGCANPNNPYGIAPLRVTTAGCIVDRDGNVNFSGVRASLRLLATDNLEFNLSADYSSDHRNPAATVLLNYRTLTAANIANIQPTYDANPANDAQGTAFVVPYGSYYNYASYYNPVGTFNRTGATGVLNYPMVESRAKPGATFDGGGVSLVIDWKLTDSINIKSITAKRQYESSFTNDNDLSPLTSSIGDGELPFHSFSQELRLNGAFGTNDMFEYTVGGFYMTQSSRYQSWQDLRYTGGNPLQFQQNDIVNADTQAAFVHLSYKIMDPLTFTTGVRYTKEHKDYNFIRLSRDGTGQPFLGSLNNLVSNYDGNNVDYRAALQYSWTDDIMTYLQYSTGFKGGGVSPRPFFTWQAVAFEPEKLKSAELGAKMDFFERKLRLNPSVFQGKYSAIQLGLLACPAVPGPAAPCGQVANAGDATIKGFELEATLHPVTGLAIDASYSYLRFDWDSINPDVGGPTRLAGIQLNHVAPYMPESKWAVGIQYEIGLGDGSSLIPRLDASNQGDMYANANNHPSAVQPDSNFIEGYSLVNARLTWKEGEGKWEVAAEVTNLTDKYYLLTRTDQYTGAGHTDGQPGRPREWAVTVKRKFK